MIRFRCACGNELEATEEQVGRRHRCPECEAVCTVPTSSLSADEATDAARSSKGRQKRAPEEEEEGWDDRRRRASRRTTSGKALASLVLGILFPLACLTGLPAMILAILALQDIGRSRGRVGGKGLAVAGLILGILGALLTGVYGIGGLLWPAISKVHQAKDRLISTNNLNQMAVGLISYADANKGLPLAVAPPRPGQLPVSWRVAILPYLGEDKLYAEYRMDEPWDGPNNSQLLKRMPQVYAHPAAPAGKTAEGWTYYRVFIGGGAALDPSNRGVDGRPTFLDFLDGTSNTVTIVEAADPIAWTKPEELAFDPNAPLPRLGGFFPGFFLAATADGKVHQLRQDIDDRSMRALITRSGGEKVNWATIEK